MNILPAKFVTETNPSNSTLRPGIVVAICVCELCSVSHLYFGGIFSTHNKGGGWVGALVGESPKF